MKPDPGRVRAVRLALLPVLVLSVVVPAGASDGTIRSLPYVTSAGDLDGDGARDTLSTENTKPVLEADGGSFFGRERSVTARSGRDAHVLWSQVIDPGRLAPARLGPAGADGILVVDGPATRWNLCDCTYYVFLDYDNITSFTAPTSDLVLRALDGAAQTTWERTFEPGQGATVDVRRPDDHTGAGSYRDAPAFGGLLDATATPAADVLVQQTSRQQVGGTATSSARLSVLEGATGQTAVSFVVATQSSDPPVAITTGDLDDDGLDDIVVMNAPEKGTVSAYGGAGGALLWRSAPGILPRFNWVEGLGDLNGDGNPELVASGVPTLAGEQPPSVARVLDGATGATILTLADTGLLPVGDVDVDGDAELLLVRRFDDGSTIRIEYRLADLTGDVLAGRTYEHAADYVSVDPAGDLDGDGITDIAHETSRYSGGQTIRERTVVSGRTLAPVFEGAAGQPLFASLDEEGDDLTSIRAEGRDVVVTAQDGASGGALWERRLRVPDDELLMSTLAWTVDAADVSGDGRPDLLVNVSLDRPEEDSDVPEPDHLHPTYREVLAWALDGRTGALLWGV